MSSTQYHPDCPFCAPTVAKVIFAESPRFRAIYNVAPILPGHSLIIPKAHFESVTELDDSEISEFAIFSRQVTTFLQQTFSTHGFNWTIQDGTEAGQTVPHLHLHIIPRSAGDLAHPGDWYPRLRESHSRHIDDDSRPRVTDEQMRSIVLHLRSQWQRR